MLGFIEGEEGLACGGLAHVDRPDEFGRVEGVEWLPEFVEDVVGDIDDVVDRAQADGFETLFEPRGRFFDGDVGDFYRGVEGAGGGRLDGNVRRGRGWRDLRAS